MEIQKIGGTEIKITHEWLLPSLWTKISLAEMNWHKVTKQVWALHLLLPKTLVSEVL